ncbi:mannitol dehydrogenase family protein [Pedococcus sp. 5OH_020]|uniref:mannitol dehydrogenase family protein n=1 Tax=Pedococcus sp. 5OH_020 TaxID=2989814 RepID=UPI0022E9BB7A|nr:mannitol dehydrogenase family protein [Pedococcus sp. 5OH_020]
MAARGGVVSRLSRASLPQVPSGPRVAGPPPSGLAERVGILHLGIGAFHRAHQAVFTEDAALAADEPGWGICGVTQRSASVVEQLRPQDCLYAVLERGSGEPTARIVGQVSDVLFAAEEGDRLTQRFTDPAVRVVTLTVTEKGYRRAATGRLDLDDPVVQSDLAGGARSTVGQIVRGLQARAEADAGGISVLSCDNLIDNGRVLHRLVMDFCAALPSAEGGAIGAWVEQHVSFPSSMVDRIVPATTEADRADAAALLGCIDEALVVAEPFRQWVIEDAFSAGRPAWERAGADLVADVAPFEQLKLRMLNGTHSLLAYLGALRGYDTIAQAVSDDELADAARNLMRQDVIPTLVQPQGLDVAAYGEQVLERFANPALRHRTTQVAMDGSQKLPLRLLGTVRDRLAAGETPEWAALAVAAWMAYVATARDRRGQELPLDDPLAQRLRQAAGTGGDATAVVNGLLCVREVFGEDLPESAAFKDCLTGHLKGLL